MTADQSSLLMIIFQSVEIIGPSCPRLVRTCHVGKQCNDKCSTTKPFHVTISGHCQDNAMTRYTGTSLSVSQSY